MPSVIVHLQNEDPVVGEMDELPKPIDYLITVKNPRKKMERICHTWMRASILSSFLYFELIL